MFELILARGFNQMRGVMIMDFTPQSVLGEQFHDAIAMRKP
jgi:hypothetical protein